MVTEIIITVLTAFIIVAVVINTFAIILYTFFKVVDFMYSPTKDKILAFIGKALSTAWKVAFFPAIWVFERI